MSHPPPLAGELVVVALKAEKLQHQAPGKQDPFCIFRVGDIVKRTKIDHGGGQYPIWDDQVNIPVAAGIHAMQVQIFNRDTNPNNLMGEGVVDLTKVLREKEHDGYFPLRFRGRQGCGDIYLELTFYGAQHTAVRPQQQVRYQYPPGHQPGYHPPQQQHHPQPPQGRPLPPVQQYHQQQTPQNRPLPPIQQQHRPPPPMQQHRPSMQPQHRPPPPSTPVQHQHPRPSPMQQHRPPPLLPQRQPQPQHFPQPQPSSSMGTSHFSPTMPSPQPLLSAPYNPIPSPAIRPNNMSYPPHDQRQSYPPPQPYQQHPPPAGGFHDPNRPPFHHGQRPPPPGGFSHPPHHNGGYPPY